MRHEALDHAVTSELVRPLVDLVNLLVKSREADLYKRKEQLIEKLSKLL
ncbi:MAG: hypothetical protein QW587_03575 [Candidatus Bathyarchaeia archaeon]